MCPIYGKRATIVVSKELMYVVRLLRDIFRLSVAVPSHCVPTAGSRAHVSYNFIDHIDDVGTIMALVRTRLQSEFFLIEDFYH